MQANRSGLTERRSRTGFTYAALTLLLCCASIPCGAVEYRMAIDGLTPGWEAITSFNHTLSHSGTGTLDHADVRLTKPLDRFSPLLAGRVCEGTALPLVRVDVLSTTTGRVHYYAIRLKDVLVSSYTIDRAADTNTPVERVTLNYTEIEWTYITTEAGGLSGSALSATRTVNPAGGGVSDPDSDGDGMPDSYEVAQGLRLLILDDDEDDDHDGLSNGDEYWAGTAAGDSNSLFQVTGVATAGGGGTTLHVTFSSVVGRTYDLYSASSVVDTMDATIPVATRVASNTTTSVDLTLPGAQKFVRVGVRVP
ncbi:MAG: type VI secretion system tube protein Hcp [Lentisphaerae bacterium]|nr:type VI secretion system tube protein Hcp [Lentisphaerota bacterium]